jgi:hypothetical protein
MSGELLGEEEAEVHLPGRRRKIRDGFLHMRGYG